MPFLTFHDYLDVCFRELGKWRLRVRWRTSPCLGENCLLNRERNYNYSLVPHSACWPPPDHTLSPARFCSKQHAGRLEQAHWPLGLALHFPLRCLLDGSFYYLFFSWIPFFCSLTLLQTQLERTNVNFIGNWRLSFLKKEVGTLEERHFFLFTASVSWKEEGTV